MAHTIIDSCLACGACLPECPVDAITEGDPMYIIDADTCIDCGACGIGCDKLQPELRKGRDFTGPNCMLRLLDLGIALGSAVKTASLHNIDNRIMYRAGAIALKLGLIKDVQVAIGIPLAITGKNIYFDRAM